MKILSKRKFLALSTENVFAIQKYGNTAFLLADIENNDNVDAKYPQRIEEFPHWELPKETSLLEGVIRLRGEKCGGICFNEDCENACDVLLGYLTNPTILYAEHDLETKDILKTVADGDYIIAVGDDVLVNEFDTPEDRTENYKTYRKAMAKLHICDIIQSTNRLATISAMISTDPEWEDETNNVLYPFRKIIQETQTGCNCTKCGNPLLMSDLPQYDFYCPECDENY